MHVDWFVPADANYAQVDLLAWDDDDNNVRSIYGYIYGRRGLEFVREVGDSWTTYHDVPRDFGNESFYLRLQKTGFKGENVL